MFLAYRSKKYAQNKRKRRSCAEAQHDDFMGICCGVDMVEIERVKESIDKYGDSFIRKVFTPDEIGYCEKRKAGKYESYAARFAAKEAVSKALGTGFTHGVSPTVIEMVTEEGGKPRVILHGAAMERYLLIGGVSMDISVTHSREYATAFAVILTRDQDDKG